MKKRIHLLLLAAALLCVLLCVLLPKAVSSARGKTSSGICGAKGNNLSWTLDKETGLLRIEGSGAMKDYDWNSPAPWFYERESITQVSLPDGLTSIGNKAFNQCGALTGAVIPEGVTRIGDAAFYKCTALSGVTIPSGVTAVGEQAFAYCRSLTAVTVPEGVTRISRYSFLGCSALKTVTVSDGVTQIGDEAFNSCIALTAVSLPDSLKRIGSGAFYGCAALAELRIPDGLCSVGGSAFRGTAYEQNEANWENGLLYLGNWVLAAKPETGAAALRQGTRGIAEYAFYGCADLADVTLPDSVTYVGSRAFLDTAYEQTEANWEDGLLYLGDWLLQAKQEITAARLRRGTRAIADGAFAGCEALERVTLPNGVARIGRTAFIDCPALSAIHVVKSNANYSSLDGVLFNKDQTELIVFPAGKPDVYYAIPDGVTSIHELAFFNCTGLSSLTVPASVTRIGELALGFGWGEDAQGEIRLSTFSIFGDVDSTAQAYAERNELRFYSMEDAVGDFLDVKTTDYFAEPVLWAVNHDPVITAGIWAHSFGPDIDCTREQIVTFLWAANGKPEPELTESPFSDVPDDSWLVKPVLWALENDITSGDGSGSFGVGEICTRGQAMAFLWAANGRPEPKLTESPFTDVPEDEWYCDAILWALENNITAGVGDGLFGVDDSCTRAQIITFLYRVYGEE